MLQQEYGRQNTSLRCPCMFVLTIWRYFWCQSHRVHLFQHTLKITGVESQMLRLQNWIQMREKERCPKFMYVGRLLYFFSELTESSCDFKLMYLFYVDLSSSWFKFIGILLPSLIFYRDRPLHIKEDHATSMVHISFGDTQPVLSIIIIIIITLSLGVNISTLLTTTLKGDYPS